MRKSDLRRLVAEYVSLRQAKNNAKYGKKLGELEHRYFLETGRNIADDLYRRESVPLRVKMCHSTHALCLNTADSNIFAFSRSRL
ncbi:hypothetical protein [Candidatus Nitrosotenuis uzonensis]|uniref:Uncharacterized protein n=1 Tax=Candidatus Nitrosotenuis uzonensis TaxID=1407055 RepID=V6ASK5_9ARCH|nr:hypothetical protein [Candidatus Nitrosotenuis uzonensis]CDI05520.1 conserved hypothetical protein [Candidatus Nitrosotenuis uzonensis]